MKDAFGGLNLEGLVKQFQQEFEKKEAEIANITVEGESGAGLVKIKMTGNYDIKQVEIDPTVLPGFKEEDKQMLEDLIAAAMNAASRKVEAEKKDKITNIGGFNLPPGFKFPFGGN